MYGVVSAVWGDTDSGGWQGIKYRKNELYIDVMEDVNLLMSKEGTILRSDVEGKVTLTCRCCL